MEEKFRVLEDLFDSIIDEIKHPERKGSFKNPFADVNSSSGVGIDGAVSVISVKIAEDKMSASVIVNSHTEKHKPFTMADIFNAVSEAGVIYGVDTPSIVQMANRQIFNRAVTIAYGTKPEKGKDGHLSPCYKAGEDGKVTVSAGDVICRIVEPTKGEFGMNVIGEALESEMGNPVRIPRGENIKIRGDNIIATESGTLHEKNGSYSIVNEQVIDRDITSAGGPIHFSGSLVINGGVGERAYIKAGNSLVIKGKCSGAVIEAEKDIILEREAMDCVITSKSGKITCEGFTNCVVTAGTDIETAFMFRCKTKAVNVIRCTDGQGVISGGSVDCMGQVFCNVAGNRHRDKTLFYLGDPSEYYERRYALDVALKRIELEMEKIDKRIKALDRGEKTTVENKSFIEAAERIKERKEKDKRPIMAQLREVNRAIEVAETAALFVKSNLYMGVTIEMGKFRQVIDHDRGKTTVQANNKGIVLK